MDYDKGYEMVDDFIWELAVNDAHIMLGRKPTEEELEEYIECYRDKFL